MQNPSYLIKSRHSIYYFRYPLPIAQSGRSKRISISLGTRCPKEALRLANILEYHSTLLTNNLNWISMNHSEIKEMFQRYYAEVLERSKKNIDTNGQLSKANVQNIQNELLRIDDLIDNECDDISELYGLNENPADWSVHKELQPIFNKFSLSYDINSSEYKAIRNFYKFALRNHFMDLLAYNRQAMDYSILDTPPANTSKSNQYTLGEVMEKYIDEIKLESSDSTLNENERHLKYLIDLYGKDKPIRNLDFEEARQVKNNLKHTPANKNKYPSTKNKTLLEQIRIAQDNNMEMISISSINKYLGYFSRFFRWARRNNYVEENIFEGLLIKRNKQDSERQMFDKSEVSLILQELQDNKSGKVKNKSQYWGALLCIYTGARKNEICSLRVTDVLQDKETGMWYFNITDEEEGKRLKTKAAKRVVPIHSKLLELGFLDFLEEARKIVETRSKYEGIEPRLLYHLKQTKDGQWGRSFGQFINDRLLPYLNLHIASKKTLHSLRHSFITYLDIAQVSGSTIKAMVGHEQGTVTHGTYTKFKEGHLESFREAIEKLPY